VYDTNERNAEWKNPCMLQNGAIRCHDMVLWQAYDREMDQIQLLQTSRRPEYCEAQYLVTCDMYFPLLLLIPKLGKSKSQCLLHID